MFPSAIFSFFIFFRSIPNIAPGRPFCPCNIRNSLFTIIFTVSRAWAQAISTWGLKISSIIEKEIFFSRILSYSFILFLELTVLDFLWVICFRFGFRAKYCRLKQHLTDCHWTILFNVHLGRLPVCVRGRKISRRPITNAHEFMFNDTFFL